MQVKNIRAIAIVGAGFMGHGIGQEFATAGYDVVLHDISEERLDQARHNIARNLNDLVQWGLLPAEQVPAALERIRYTTDLAAAVNTADLVVEAVFEDLGLKREVFAQLDALCPLHTILASNTSTLMPSLLAEATGRPDRVLVTHYFYPPALLPLVEVVPGPRTAPEVVETVCTLLERVGKSPIVVRKEVLGFIANRLQFALQREALYLVERGIATPEEVDIAVRDGFGRRLAVAGPFEIAEPIGWDLELRIQTYLFPDLCASPAPSPLVREKVWQDELGVKSGQGFYSWTPQAAEAWRQHMVAVLVHLARLAARNAEEEQDAGAGD
jgi:3-hydroxybutyryl-CoA dehydrogenase